MRLLLLGALLLAGGCPPDLSRFHLEGEDGGRPGRDGGRDAGGPGEDGGVIPGDCPLPNIYVLLLDLDGTTRNGRILRFSVPAGWTTTNPITPCSELSGANEDGPDRLPEHIYAVALLRPDRMLVAGDGLVSMLDPTTDDIRWGSSLGGERAIDAFRVEHPDGRVLGAVAVDRRLSTGPVVNAVYLFDPDSPEPAFRFEANGELRVGLGIPSATNNPYDPNGLAVLKTGSSSNTAALAAVFPYDGMALTDELVPYPADTVLDSLYAFHDGMAARFAWTGRPTGGGEGGLFYRFGDAGGASGPIRCEPGPCSGGYLVAVPDPSLNTSHVVLCEGEGGVRHVVRMRSTGSRECEIVVDGNSVGENWRVHRLSVALP